MCRRVELNHRPERYECSALTTELRRLSLRIITICRVSDKVLHYISRGRVTVARKAHNLEVVGSIPIPATKKQNHHLWWFCLFMGIEANPSATGLSEGGGFRRSPL